MNDEIQYEREKDAICNDFETLWSTSQSPDFSSFLIRIDESKREELLFALIEVDLELREKAGLSDDPVDYQNKLSLLPEYNAAMEKLIAGKLEANKDLETKLDSITTTHSTVQPSENDEIAGFELLERIGQGGMGTVWKAQQQTPIRRLVALKIVRAELGSRDVITRFDAERQALAMMDHVNIARIFDGGVHQKKQPWFAMELVEGLPINEYCDGHKLLIQDRLELCIQICRAVQHAHQKGIIHRDLKPSNVLVTESDGQRIVKVIDFGLAKALKHTTRLTDQTLATEFGQVLGTLTYMSPEQASVGESIDVDTQTDVYSIGVILYELLTGSTPLQSGSFKNKSILEILERIRDFEVPRPSDRLTSLPPHSMNKISQQRGLDPSRLLTILTGDLDWVVKKALEQDREHRYQSASGLADDLQRYLSEDTVEARPPTFGYRTKKFIRRNRAAVAVAGLVTASLTIGFVATYRQMMRAMDAEQLSERRRVDAMKAKDQANANADEAKRQSQLAFSTLFSVISDIQNGLKNVPGGDSIRQVLLKRSIEKLESTAAIYVNEAAVAHNSVIALNDLGDLALTLEESVTSNRSKDRDTSVEPGVEELAKSFYQRAFEIASELAQSEPEDPDTQRLLAASNQRLGSFHLKIGQSDQAEQYLDTQFRLANKLISNSADNPENMRTLADSLEHQGNLSLVKQNVSQALEKHEAARAIRIRLKNLFANDVSNQYQLSRSYIRINEIMLQLGRVDDGLEQLESAQKTLRQMIQDSPENLAYQRDLLVALEREGDIFQALRRFDDARASYDEALSLSTRLLDLEPNNLESMSTKSISHQKLGRLLLNQESLEEALNHYRQSIQLDEAIINVNPLDLLANDGLAVSLGKRGEIQLRRKETEKALDDFRRSMAIRKKIAGADPGNRTLEKKLSVSYQRLGTYFVQIGDLDSAFLNHNESYKICKRLAELDPENDSAQRFLLSNYEHLAIVFAAMDQPAKAVDELEKMVEIGQARTSALPDHPGVQHDYLYSCLRLAQAFQTTRELKKSRELCTVSIEHAASFLRKSPNEGIEAMKGELEACTALSRLREQALENLDDFLEAFPDSSKKFSVVEQPDFSLASLLNYRANTFVIRNQFHLAAETACKISELDDVDNSQLFAAARLLIRCATGLKQSSGSGSNKSDSAANDQSMDWQARAISMLQKAAGNGWEGFDELQSAPEFEILRDTPEFEALLKHRSRSDTLDQE